jgi:hypothetical protein
MNLLPGSKNQISPHGTCVDAYECHLLRAVVKNRNPHLARIVKALQICLSIAPRFLHADFRSNVSFGKTSPENLVS